MSNSVTSSNFSFLTKHDAVLVRHAALDERYVFDRVDQTAAVWGSSREVSLLVQRVEYDAANESVEITFHEIGDAMEVTR
ncbi:MAG: hypothetical protein NXI22_00815 [bacterium]|nr:hypothetical protein [bacterium]